MLTPWSQAKSVEYQRLLESRDEVSSVTPGVFRESRSADRVFFVDKLSERDDVVNNVFVQSTQNNRLGVMVAEKGYIETAENGDRFVVLLNGRRYEGAPGTLDYRTVDFDRYALRIEPRNARLWHELARVRLKQGQFAQAENVAARSNSWAGDDRALRAENWRLIAESRRARGDADGAKAALDAAAR